MIAHSAHAFILVHNHPSGDPRPSDADLRLTRRLSEAARILQIQMLDHVIIAQPMNGRQGYFSFKESGLSHSPWTLGFSSPAQANHEGTFETKTLQEKDEPAEKAKYILSLTYISVYLCC